MNNYVMSSELTHHGVLGMKWGVRRYQPYGSGGYNPKNKGEFRPDKKESSDKESPGQSSSKDLSNNTKTPNLDSIDQDVNSAIKELKIKSDPLYLSVGECGDVVSYIAEKYDPEITKLREEYGNIGSEMQKLRKKLDTFGPYPKSKEFDKLLDEYNKLYDKRYGELQPKIIEREEPYWDLYADWRKKRREIEDEKAEHTDVRDLTQYAITNNELYHHGVLGMKWGIRRYQPYGTAYDAEHKGKFVGERKTKKTRSDRDPQANRSSINGRKGANKLNAKSVEKLKKRSSENKDEVTIDVSGAKTKQEVHDKVKQTVKTPDHYGNNLDALNDVLTEQNIKKVNVKGLDTLDGDMKDYGSKLQKLADDINKDSNSEYTIDKVIDDNGSKETNKIAKEFVDLCGKDNTPYEDVEKFIEKHEDNYDVMDNGDHIIVADKNSGAYTMINYSNKKRTEKYKEDVKADKQKLEELKKQPDKKVNYNPKTEEEYLQSVFNLYDNEMKKRNVLHDTDLSDEDVGEIEELVRKIQKPTKSKKVKHTDVRDLTQYAIANDELYHHGVLGMKWGVRKR